MKPTYALMVFLMGLSLLGSPMASDGFCSDPQIPWSEDLSDTMEMARKTGKPVLVHFYGDNCPPCRMLEKKAFKDRQLIEAISENLLAVKINAERDTKTAARFRVNRWPTDVYLFPDGQEIYRNISAQDPTAYEKTVLKVAEKNKRMVAQQRPKRSDPTRAQLMAMQTASPQQPEVSNPVANPVANPAANPALAQRDEAMSPDAPATATLAKSTRVRLNESISQSVDVAPVKVEMPIGVTAQPNAQANAQPIDSQPPVVEVPAPAPAAKPEPAPTQAPATQPAVLPTSIAMNGYCPVSLGSAIAASQSGSETLPAWVKGKPEFAVRHRGRVYHCVSEEALAKFLGNPDQYAPVLSGCDLVEYSKSGKWIDGDCRFGFIDKETGRIFLFSSSLNCQEFAQNCESYSSMVGKPTGR